MTLKAYQNLSVVFFMVWGGGLLTGIADSVTLLTELTDENGQVPFVHSGKNICESFQLSYEDHLRGMLLYRNEDEKLSRVQTLK